MFTTLDNEYQICNSQFLILSVTIVLTRFRLACHGRDSSTSYLPVTVFVQDINDNPPVFQSQGDPIGVFDRVMQFDTDTVMNTILTHACTSQAEKPTTTIMNI